MKYLVKKRYGHEQGLSACFRQWRAKSHCRFFHGYALSFEFTFGADSLDENNWVIDYGSLKPVKEWLVEMFDHKVLIAIDDPHYVEASDFFESHELGEVKLVNSTGCEAFAQLAYNYVNNWLIDNKQSPRVKLLSVEVREHDANGAVYKGKE